MMDTYTCIHLYYTVNAEILALKLSMRVVLYFKGVSLVFERHGTELNLCLSLPFTSLLVNGQRDNNRQWT